MISLPDFLSSGTPARLFPVVADTRREERTLSILLAVLTRVPAFYRETLGSVGVRTGARTRVSAYTEVGIGSETGAADRPDGLLLVETGRTTWSALVEAKVGRSALDPDQVERYLKLARDNGIDAVITISNDFAARPTHSAGRRSDPALAAADRQGGTLPLVLGLSRNMLRSPGLPGRRGQPRAGLSGQAVERISRPPDHRRRALHPDGA